MKLFNCNFTANKAKKFNIHEEINGKERNILRNNETSTKYLDTQGHNKVKLSNQLPQNTHAKREFYTLRLAGTDLLTSDLAGTDVLTAGLAGPDVLTAGLKNDSNLLRERVRTCKNV